MGYAWWLRLADLPCDSLVISGPIASAVDRFGPDLCEHLIKCFSNGDVMFRMLHDSPEEVLQFISKKLSDSSVREAKFGITTSPHWRMTKTPSIPAENESECTMEPHEKSWGSMFVLYTHWGQDVGDLEVAAIANFRSNPKVKNLNPGKEGYSHDHPSFFYMVGNSLQDIVRFASLRKRNAGQSVCFA